MSIDRVEFANFVCHFGRDKVMLDYLTEIVLPAFTDDTLIRQRGQENVTEYRFYDVHLEKLEREKGITISLASMVNLLKTLT
jgi:hypothetical protein